jgi:hypothetical protein
LELTVDEKWEQRGPRIEIESDRADDRGISGSRGGIGALIDGSEKTNRGGSTDPPGYVVK